jgi:hypothetical protein
MQPQLAGDGVQRESRLLVQSFIGWSAQDASLFVDAKIAVHETTDARLTCSARASLDECRLTARSCMA